MLTIANEDMNPLSELLKGDNDLLSAQVQRRHISPLLTKLAPIMQPVMLWIYL